MHPVIAHFLDPKAVRAALEKSAGGRALTDIEQLFATAANAHPDRKARAMKATGGGDLDDQQAALALAVFAALAMVEKDPVLGPVVQDARRALKETGATEEDTQQFLSLILLEEAFGFDDEADAFDADLVAESFRTLPRLAALDEDKVGALEETFLEKIPPAGRPLLLATSHALFGAAWGEGPVPVSPEHIETALEELRGQTSDDDFEAAAKGLQSLLQLLAREGLIGLQRLKRLLDTTTRVARALTLGAGEGEDDELEDDDDALDDGLPDLSPPSGRDHALTDPLVPTTAAPDDDLTDPLAAPIKPPSNKGGTRN